MTVKLARKKLSDLTADLVAVAVRDGKETSGAVSDLPKPLRDLVAARVKRLSFKGKPGATLLVQGDGQDLLLVGVGDGKSNENWRRASASLRSAAAGTRSSTIAFALDAADKVVDVLAPALEGFLLAGYSFEKYRARKDGAYVGPKSLTLSSPALTVGFRANSIVETTEGVCEAVCLARDLVNEMPSFKVPSHLASVARSIGRARGVSCEVWTGARLRKEKMNGILGVSAGSHEGGALIKLVYKPAKRAKGKIAIVGKGITFDSGGLSIKPAKSMETLSLIHI